MPRLVKHGLALLLLTLVATTNASASEQNDTASQAEPVTLDQAVHRVKKHNPGKVLDAKTVEKDGKPVHVIKVLTKKGHVKKIRINSTPKQ